VQIEKKTIAKLDKVYAVKSINIRGETYIIAATEEKGSCLLFSPPDWKISKIWDEPGGTMEIIPLEKDSGAILAIQKFYPIFQSEGACISYAEPGDSITEPWKVVKVLDLPFVHRISKVNIKNNHFLISSTLCSGKDYMEDWSKPGAIYASPIPSDIHSKWEIKPICEGISKNHGLHVTRLDKKTCILACGEEGVFKINVPENEKESWSNVCWLNKGVSDVYMFDIDEDGNKELITIEPFHGNNLNIYKIIDEKWDIVFERKITFGHVVWGGTILGNPSVIYGCRGGNKELAILTDFNNKFQSMKYQIIDEGKGAASIEVIHKQEYDMIISANHGANEVAIYSIYK